MTPEDSLRLFAHALCVLPPAQATAYADRVLHACPLSVAAGRCQNGGLRSGDWLPVALAAKDLVQRLHDPAGARRADRVTFSNGSVLEFSGNTMPSRFTSAIDG